MSDPVAESVGPIWDIPDDLDVTSQMLFSVLAGQMRVDAKHLSMPTVQHMLLERILSNYMRVRKLEQEENVQQVPLMRYHAEQWLKCTVEYNKVVSRTQSADAREAYMGKVTDVIMLSLETIEDVKERRKMAQLFISAMESAGL